jgi:hypothetical protein
MGVKNIMVVAFEKYKNTLDIAPIIVWDIALVFGIVTIAGVPLADLAQLFLMLILNPASSMNTQFLV